MTMYKVPTRTCVKFVKISSKYCETHESDVSQRAYNRKLSLDSSNCSPVSGEPIRQFVGHGSRNELTELQLQLYEQPIFIGPPLRGSAFMSNCPWQWLSRKSPCFDRIVTVKPGVIPPHRNFYSFRSPPATFPVNPAFCYFRPGFCATGSTKFP
jgi:hypothetical protein